MNLWAGIQDNGEDAMPVIVKKNTNQTKFQKRSLLFLYFIIKGTDFKPGVECGFSLLRESGMFDHYNIGERKLIRLLQLHVPLGQCQ